MYHGLSFEKVPTSPHEKSLIIRYDPFDLSWPSYFEANVGNVVGSSLQFLLLKFKTLLTVGLFTLILLRPPPLGEKDRLMNSISSQ